MPTLGIVGTIRDKDSHDLMTETTLPMASTASTSPPAGGENVLRPVA